MAEESYVVLLPWRHNNLLLLRGETQQLLSPGGRSTTGSSRLLLVEGGHWAAATSYGEAWSGSVDGGTQVVREKKSKVC